MKKPISNFRAIGALLGAITVAAALSTTSCSTVPVQASWRSKGGALPRGLSVELVPGKDGGSTFRVRGDELGGATLTGEAKPDGDSWRLEVTGMDWFSNWSEGWSEARFAAEGELRLRPEGTTWLLDVDSMPRIESPTAASIRLYGDYYEGDKALALFTHRWDRIQAADSFLRQRFPDAWFDYAEQRKIHNWWDLFTRRVVNFQESVRGFLFPELYGYPKESQVTGRVPLSRPDKGRYTRTESIDWDTAYTKENFPEELRALRDSGTMLRDFEEGSGLWRLDFCWDALWSDKIRDVAFVKK